MSACDLFLSYHSSDRKSVQTVRRLLEARGIATFLDRENLVAGLPWPQALEEALRSVGAVAVFLGPHGLGFWQKREMWFALDRQAREEKAERAFPVIPVLLHGVDITPGFLFLNTWVDLRHDLTDPEALDALVQAVRGTAPTRSTELTVALCPYRGLRAFREEDAAFFFGRETFAERLLEKTLGRNLVAIVGPSGSGKSSVVQAGLLPLLRRQRPPAMTWDAVSFTPGDRPFHRLAATLIPLLESDLSETDRLVEARKLGDHLASGGLLLEDAVERVLTKSEGTDRLLLVVDQFEELFTLTLETDRQPFVKALLQAQQDQAPLSLLFTLRADFYGHAIALSRDLSDRLEGGVVNLGPMTRRELEQAIVEPAKRVGLGFEPGLVRRILDDIAGEPGDLPLLEFALTELWTRRQGGLLTHVAYEDIGEVVGAIAQQAEKIFKYFTPEQQKTVRLVFSRLVRVARPEEGGEDTRQRANLGDLDAKAQQVAQALTDARLLVTGRDEATGEETVEVAHEALIRNWARLRSWLDEDREFLLWRQRLRADLAEWLRTKRDEGTLLRGALLAEAERWLAERAEDLSLDEEAFIRTSREQQMLEEQRWKKLYEEAERRSEEAELHRQIALARQLAAQAEMVRSTSGELLLRSVLLAVESLRHYPTLEGDRALRRGLALLPHPVAHMTHESSVVALVFSPDGRYLATASRDHTARVWELTDGQEVARIIHEGDMEAVTFSSDGKYLATASEDHTARVWELISGREVVCMTHDRSVHAMVFSPGGKHLATASRDGTARVWEVAKPEKIILFGSAARGEMGPNSDVDLLVVKRGKFDRSRLVGDIYSPSH